MVFKRVSLVFFSLIFSLIFIEVWLRLYTPKEFARVRTFRYLFQPHPLLRYTLRPNVRTYIESEAGGTLLVETNSYGLRDKPYQAKHGCKNILGLGDSYLFADGVNQEDGLMAVLQRMLDGDSPGRYRALNAGVPGYSTNQEILYYLEKGDSDFDPDVVILFFLANDVVLYQGNVANPDIRFYKGIPVPHMVITDDFTVDTILPNKPQITTWATWDYVKFLKRIYWNNVKQVDIPAQKTRDLYVEARQFNIESTEEGWRYTAVKAMLKQLKRKTSVNGAKLMIVYLPSAREVEDGFAREMYYKKYNYPKSSWDWDLPSGRVEKMAKEIGMDFVNPIPALRAEARKLDHSLYLKGYGHFTSEGHRLMAEILYPYLLQVLKRDVNTDSANSDLEVAAVDLPQSNEELQIIYRITPGDIYRHQFISSPTKRIRDIHFYIHQKSDSVVLSVSTPKQKMNRLVIPPFTTKEMRRVNLLFGESDGDHIEISIQSHNITGNGVLITEPIPAYQ